MTTIIQMPKPSRDQVTQLDLSEYRLLARQLRQARQQLRKRQSKAVLTNGI
jgi:hypothetical protein